MSTPPPTWHSMPPLLKTVSNKLSFPWQPPPDVGLNTTVLQQQAALLLWQVKAAHLLIGIWGPASLPHPCRGREITSEMLRWGALCGSRHTCSLLPGCVQQPVAKSHTLYFQPTMRLAPEAQPTRGNHLAPTAHLCSPGTLTAPQRGAPQGSGCRTPQPGHCHDHRRSQHQSFGR